MVEVRPEFAAAMRELLIADVRLEAERRTLGWIPGSRRVLPWMVEDCAGQGIIVVCQTGKRSSEVLDQAGLSGPHVYNLTGGIRAWEAAGLPLCRPVITKAPIQRPTEPPPETGPAWPFPPGALLHPGALTPPASLSPGQPRPTLLAGATLGKRPVAPGVALLVRELRSCFVVESVVSNPEAYPFDPIEVFDRLFAAERLPTSQADFEDRLDQLSEAAWSNGHPLTVIADNVERFYAQAATVTWG